MKRFECNICGELFDTEELCLEHLENEEEIESNPEIYMTVMEIDSLSELAEIEPEDFRKYCEDNPQDPICKRYSYSGIEEDEGEIPDEEDFFTDEDVDELTELLEAVEDYQHLPLEDKKMVLDSVLPSEKKLRKGVTTSNLIEELYIHAVERLNDTKSFVCPYCHVDLQAQAKLSDGKVSVDPRFVKVKHLRNAHKYLYEVLRELFMRGKSERKLDDDRALTYAEQYHLSKEELSQRISEDPEMRREFFKIWKRRLEQRE